MDSQTRFVHHSDAAAMLWESTGPFLALVPVDDEAQEKNTMFINEAFPPLTLEFEIMAEEPESEIQDIQNRELSCSSSILININNPSK